MRTIHPYLCGVIPLHMLRRLAEQPDPDIRQEARHTLERMQEMASGRIRAFLDQPSEHAEPHKRRRIYDAQGRWQLPGKLVLSEHKRSRDIAAIEVWDGIGLTYEFYNRILGRKSIDGRNLPLEATIHYGEGFQNAIWNGRQIVCGDGDGRLFTRFTRPVEVIAHELTHGVAQHAASLGYYGETGAINEHLADVFGIMVKQYAFGMTAADSDWLIGSGLYGPAVNGQAVRSLAAPGTAYDDPILGRDPQPSHMRDYFTGSADNGGVHINSGIPNRAFYLAAITFGGASWEIAGQIWYAVMIERLTPEVTFAEFAQATVDIAGERYGVGGWIQHVIVQAWAEVGIRVRTFLDVSLPARLRVPVIRAAEQPKWRTRPLRMPITTHDTRKETK